MGYRSKPRLVIVRRVLLNVDGTFDGDYVTVAELHRCPKREWRITNESAPMMEREANRLTNEAK